MLIPFRRSPGLEQFSHVVILSGRFPYEQETHYLKEMVMDKARVLGIAKVIPIINHLQNPQSNGSRLRYGVSDIVAAAELPLPVFTPFKTSHTTFHRSDTLSPEDFLKHCRPSQEELARATKVQQMVENLI